MANYNTKSEVQNDYRDKVMSVKDWLVVSLLMMIPLVNIIILFVWGFSDSENRNKTNWAKAQLIMFAIVIGLWTLAFIVFGSMLALIFAGGTV